MVSGVDLINSTIFWKEKKRWEKRNSLKGNCLETKYRWKTNLLPPPQISKHNIQWIDPYYARMIIFLKKSPEIDFSAKQIESE